MVHIKKSLKKKNRQKTQKDPKEDTEMANEQ